MRKTVTIQFWNFSRCVFGIPILRIPYFQKLRCGNSLTDIGKSFLAHLAFSPEKQLFYSVEKDNASRINIRPASYAPP